MLSGSVAAEQVARNAGHDIEVPFTPGHTDASQDQTDAEFVPPPADSQWVPQLLREEPPLLAEYRLADRANLRTSTAPEMTVLVGGLRALLYLRLPAVPAGVLTSAPGSLTNDFLANLLNVGTAPPRPRRLSGLVTASPVRSGGRQPHVGLVFGSNSELRAVAEVYATEDAHEKVCPGLRSPWTKLSGSTVCGPGPDVCFAATFRHRFLSKPDTLGDRA
ncbi:hypothetical protein [Actinophytocola sp.]|uniref:hypothetical protein n=1 Tax=Actinophytocola sp. TaxID=1872138 RepID=UPI003D6B878A